MFQNRSIANSKDTLFIYQLHKTLIDTLEKRLKITAVYSGQLAEAYGDRAMYALFLNKFKEAEILSRKGLEMDSTHYNLKRKLGHSLLFQGKYGAAFDVYQDYADDEAEDSEKANVELIIQDFEDLKKTGLTHKDIEKVKKALQKKE